MEFVVARGQIGHICEPIFHILTNGEIRSYPQTLEPNWQVTGSKLSVVGKADADSIHLNPVVNLKELLSPEK